MIDPSGQSSQLTGLANASDSKLTSYGAKLVTLTFESMVCLNIFRLSDSDTVPPALDLKESVAGNTDFELKRENGHS